jgi:hypothetical protein
MSARGRSLVALALLALMASQLVIACGDDDDRAAAQPSDAATGQSGSARQYATGSLGGAAPPAAPAMGEPPATTATANGQTVDAGIGTYCWTLLCVDKIGVPTGAALTVSSGDIVTVAIPSAAPPFREASVNAFEAVNAMPLDGGGEIWPYPGTPGHELAFAVTNDGIEVTLDLQSGRYVLAVSMFFEPGDVVFGVLLEVQ